MLFAGQTNAEAIFDRQKLTLSPPKTVKHGDTPGPSHGGTGLRLDFQDWE